MWNIQQYINQLLYSPVSTVTYVNNERNIAGCQNRQEPNKAGHL